MESEILEARICIFVFICDRRFRFVAYDFLSTVNEFRRSVIEDVVGVRRDVKVEQKDKLTSNSTVTSLGDAFQVGDSSDWVYGGFGPEVFIFVNFSRLYVLPHLCLFVLRELLSDFGWWL